MYGFEPEVLAGNRTPVGHLKVRPFKMFLELSLAVYKSSLPLFEYACYFSILGLSFHFSLNHCQLVFAIVFAIIIIIRLLSIEIVLR